jgi:hypothetical protein
VLIGKSGELAYTPDVCVLIGQSGELAYTLDLCVLIGKSGELAYTPDVCVLIRTRIRVPAGLTPDRELPKTGE